MRKIDKIIVHCADTPEGRDVRAAEIKRWHTKERGWNDIGYHYVIDLDGTIEPGRPIEVAGAHCTGHNANSIGICYVGGCDKDMKPKDTRTEAQKTAMLTLLKYLVAKYPGVTIYGHRDFNAGKSCPSFDTKTEYAELCAV